MSQTNMHAHKRLLAKRDVSHKEVFMLPHGLTSTTTSSQIKMFRHKATGIRGQ